MGDYFKDESKVGAMLRYMSGDVALAMRRDLEKLYGDTPSGIMCAKWHWLLVKYSSDPVMMRKYISIIEYAYEYDILLEDMNSWKKTMRIIMPEEFMYKMKEFSQVPRIAIMDDGHENMKKKTARDQKDVLW